MRRPLFFSTLVITSLCTLSGCGFKTGMLNRFPEAETRAKKNVELLRAGEFDSLKQQLSTNLLGPKIDTTLGEMQAQFPDDPPESAKVVGVRSFQNSDQIDVDITLEYEFKSSWMIVEEATRQTSQETRVTSLHVEPMALSLEQTNSFSPLNKGPVQYTIFLAGLGSLAVCIFAFVRCIQSSMRRKWLWCFVCLLGIGRLTVNWTDAHVVWQLLWFQIPPMSAFTQEYSPWAITASLPLGALIVLARLRNARIKLLSRDERLLS